MLRPFISYSLPMFYNDKAGGTLSFCFSDNKVLIRKHIPIFHVCEKVLQPKGMLCAW